MTSKTAEQPPEDQDPALGQLRIARFRHQNKQLLSRTTLTKTSVAPQGLTPASSASPSNTPATTASVSAGSPATRK